MIDAEFEHELITQEWLHQRCQVEKPRPTEARLAGPMGV